MSHASSITKKHFLKDIPSLIYLRHVAFKLKASNWLKSKTLFSLRQIVSIKTDCKCNVQHNVQSRTPCVHIGLIHLPSTA